MNENIFTKKYPVLDIHGETEATADLLIKTFINDNYKLQNKNFLIIHGIGEGILKHKTHEILSNDHRILSYKLDEWNLGTTIVQITLDNIRH